MNDEDLLILVRGLTAYTLFFAGVAAMGGPAAYTVTLQLCGELATWNPFHCLYVSLCSGLSGAMAAGVLAASGWTLLVFALS